jgi:L-lactate dehydrogenase complex protein LldF
LREEFLSADMGISGANFMVAETGTMVIVTNEGNGRMCTTLPPVHVAVVGIDKVVPDLESLNVLLKLLPRSATGQKMSSYVSFVGGPRRTDEENGPKEFHLVLIDNGRTRILQDTYTRETLLCIRCGVCANVCPVYNNVGGHAYGWVYSGPIGAILAPQLLGVKVAGDLPFASSLCGACVDFCPVKIPITNILLHLRHRVVEGDAIEKSFAPASLHNSADFAVQTFRFPWMYELGSQMLKALQAPLRRGNWLPNLPPPMNRWTMARPMPAFGADFRGWFRNRKPQVRQRRQQRNFGIGLIVAGIAAITAIIFARRKK